MQFRSEFMFGGGGFKFGENFAAEDLEIKKKPVFFLDEDEPTASGFSGGEGGDCSSPAAPKPLESLHEVGLPPFLRKTYEMVDDPKTDPIISWSSNFRSFVVWDPHKLSTELLPKLFKHNNFSSFVRQLNTCMPHGALKMEESYEVNSKGVEIFSKSWLPENCSPKAVVCFCHGYGDTCTFSCEGIARKLVSSGYGVVAMDYPGFGLSEGLHGYIESFDGLVDDVIEHYSKVKEKPEYQNLPSFLLGQSMGGTVALKVHLKQPNSWSGAILVAPMCKIADYMVPPWIVTQILIGVAKIFPKQKLVPQKDLADMAIRDPQKKELAAYNIIAYKHKPRLRTALELLRTAQEIERELEKVSLPLLILQGKADIVIDPSVSMALYEKASSSDKKLNLYDDAYHTLLDGEPDDMILRVFGDILSWLAEHC